MELSSMTSSAHVPRHGRKLKVIKEELQLRDRTEKEISPLWKIITVTSYLIVVVGGITTSIAIGTLLAAFRNNCVFYARITVRGLDEIVQSGKNRTLYDEHIVLEQYGSLTDCTFSEYSSAASAIFGGMWGIMFLQCGRGGVTRRSSSPSWLIVPPALVTNLVFFVLSCITFAKTTGGLSFFCTHLQSENDVGGRAVHVTTCKDIMGFQFPSDLYNTNLYLSYILAQVASFMTFLGWLMALFVLILRCFIPIDFVVYGRRLYETHNGSYMRSEKEVHHVHKVDSNPSSETATTSFVEPTCSKKVS